MGIVDRHIESSVDWKTINRLDVLGIDEIALKKGYKDYVTLITNRHDGKIRLLAVLKGKEKAAIKAFFKSIPRRLKETITAICTDMYDGYINAVKEVFGNKKGQVAIFVIIALAIVAVILVVIFYPRIRTQFGESFTPDRFLRGCVEPEIKPTLDILM